MRIELTTKAWEAFVLPLNYARKPRCYMIVARLFEKSTQKTCCKTVQSFLFYENSLVCREPKAFASYAFCEKSSSVASNYAAMAQQLPNLLCIKA